MRTSNSDRDDSCLPMRNYVPRSPTSTGLAPQWVNVRQCVNRAIKQLDATVSQQGIATSVDIPAAMQISADVQMLDMAVYSLCTSALENMQSGGDLVVTAYADARGTEIEVADSRSSVVLAANPDLLSIGIRLNRQITPGGITDAFQFADAHGGFLSVRRCPEGGAAFTLFVPPSMSSRSAA